MSGGWLNDCGRCWQDDDAFHWCVRVPGHDGPHVCNDGARDFPASDSPKDGKRHG